jgi:hypothetical protein
MPSHILPFHSSPKPDLPWYPAEAGGCIPGARGRAWVMAVKVHTTPFTYSVVRARLHIYCANVPDINLVTQG